MKLRGRIKSIQLSSKKIKIDYHDVIKWEKEKVIFEDAVPIDLQGKVKMGDKEFDASSFDQFLLYQFFKEKQLLVFEIDDPSNPKITTIEIIDD